MSTENEKPIWDPQGDGFHREKHRSPGKGESGYGVFPIESQEISPNLGRLPHPSDAEDRGPIHEPGSRFHCYPDKGEPRYGISSLEGQEVAFPKLDNTNPRLKAYEHRGQTRGSFGDVDPRKL